MTSQELEIFQLKARIAALEVLIAGLLSGFRGIPSVLEALLVKLDELRESPAKLKFPNLPPEQADMLADEVQIAFENLVTFLKTQLSKPTSGTQS